MRIEPLSLSNIQEAIQLANKVFPDDVNAYISPEKCFWVSLEPEKHSDFWKGQILANLRYFVATDEKEKTVVGITGLYSYALPREKKTAWIGWYCVNSVFRNKGFGKKILEWTIEEAKKEGYAFLCLYTTTEPSHKTARAMYEKIGFRLIEKKEIDPRIVETIQVPNTSEYQAVFYKLKL